jgi:hypothetical protein
MEIYQIPKTRGELLELLENGISCKVVADNAEITNTLLESLKIMKKSNIEWNIDYTIESGWAIFIPKLKNNN